MPADPPGAVPPSVTEILSRASHRSGGIGTNLTITCTFQQDCLTLLIAGASSDALPDRLAQGITNAFVQLRPRRAAIDLTQVASVPSVILAFLVFFQKTAEDHGVPKVVLYGVNPRVATMLKMIGMADFFATVADEAAMRAWYAERGL